VRKAAPQVAAVDPKAKPGARAPVVAARPANAAVPWTSYSPTGLANSPPPDLATRAAPGPDDAIPIPRARPRIQPTAH
jgi:hypothetical protein